MIPQSIEGATRRLGAPSNWDDSQGPCSTLPIRDVSIEGHNWMMSHWEPTPEEIAGILAGRPVRLWIAGTVHPVVGLDVNQEGP